MIPLYSRVQLTNDNFSHQGAKKGMHGYIIEIYDNGNYEVEFSDPETGITIAEIVANENDLLLFPE